MLLTCIKHYDTGYKGSAEVGQVFKVTELNENVSRIDTEDGQFLGTILNVELRIYFQTNKGMF